MPTRSSVEVGAKLDTVCTVVGTYDLREIPNKKGGPISLAGYREALASVKWWYK